MKKPELLAPGGSFAAAFHALQAGADGVYLGMREFSARAAAQNFTLEQLRRIRQLAADRGRRIYVTINTVVREEEFPRLRKSLAWLEALRVDGVILQDLGVVDLVRREYPGLAVHASTQMGVHNDSGLAIAEEMGIRRVILARELSFERIRALRERHPGIELEVFIHGALCYSFSGACLASWVLTGRSGNRGECAQVCRSVFSLEGEGGGDGDPSAGAAPNRASAAANRASAAANRASVAANRASAAAKRASASAAGHLFSTRDLFLGREVLKLGAIGVDALKIEGRMKSPEYVFNVTRLYREVLDRGEGLSDGEYEELVRSAELGFSRAKTTGWLHSEQGSRLLDPGAPGHRGAFLGNVEGVQGRQIIVRLHGDIAIHDGLAYDEGREQRAFAVLKIVKGGRDVNFARRGDTVSVEVHHSASPTMPHTGQEIRHLSSRDLDLPQPREPSFAAYKIPLDLRVSLGGGGIITVTAPGFPEFSRKVAIAPAAAKKPFFPILRALLEESGQSAFRPGSLTFRNDCGLADDGIFVRPSELKKVKNELYQFLDREFAERATSTRDPRDGPCPGDTPIASPLGDAELAVVAHRGALGPPGMWPVPFIGGAPSALHLSQLAECAGFRWLPLPPVILDEGPWIGAVRRLAERHAGTRFAIGLNNMSHLAFASSLAALGNAWFFADFFLYAANDSILSFLHSRIPRFLFAYEWLEDDPIGHEHSTGGRPIPTIRPSDDFSPPLFYSLGCLTRHSADGGRCLEGCPKDFSGELRQGKNRFRYLVRDCVTYLFRTGQ